MELAALALTDAVPALEGDEALACRERLRRMDQEQSDAQRQLFDGGNAWEA